MFLKNRYDILLGNSGKEIVLPDKNHFIVYGPRRSGKTTYLLKDMLNQEQNKRKGFFTFNITMAKELKKGFLNPGNMLNISFRSYNQNNRGYHFDCLYLDEFQEAGNNGDDLFPLIGAAERVIIAVSLWDSGAWQYSEICPPKWEFIYLKGNYEV